MQMQSFVQIVAKRLAAAEFALIAMLKMLQKQNFVLCAEENFNMVGG